MAIEITGLDGVVELMREPIRRYVGILHDTSGANVKAVALYGAILTGWFDPSVQSARSVLVLDKFDLGLLRRIAEHGLKLGKVGIAAPLIMTPAYIKASLDTFPLELIEIQQQHLTVAGEDRFTDLAFDDAHVRLQCEREFKVILIRMRQGLLAAAGRDKFVAALAADVVEELVRTLRGLLWLKGDREGKVALDVVADVEKMTDQKLPGVRSAMDTAAVQGWGGFEALYNDVEKLGEIADAW